MVFVWCPFLLGRMTGREQSAGGNRIMDGGGGVPKTVSGEEVYGMFSPPLSFPPPFVSL